jgi:hypothetical protein
VHRILKERFPLVSLDLPPEPDTRGHCVPKELEDVETGSFEDYDQYSTGAGEDIAGQDTATEAEVNP